jgi:DNA-binding winged helix-turn-helix (wHTH) protein/tetratricopeptide (TPR) repeat protein
VEADLSFDEWRFRRQPPELLRDGAGVRLQEQPLRVLDELLARPGEIVTREHLIASLWPNRVVEFDAGLNAAVRRLRAALGDEAETPRYIETVPRKGYRFIGKLRPLLVEKPAAALVKGDVAAPVLAASDEWLQAKPKKPLPLWSRAFAGHRPAVMLAASIIVVALGVSSMRQGRESVAAEVGSVTAVSEQLSRASFFAQRRVPGDLARAKQQYELALSLDPSSARAWAGLASVHWLEFAMGEQPREMSLPRVRAAAQKALDLDPRLAEAHLRMASYLEVTGHASSARHHRAEAATLQPNDPLLLTQEAAEAAEEGRLDEAIVLQRRALAGAPLAPVVAGNLAYYLFYAGRIEEAKRAFEQVVELDPTHPDEIPVLMQILEHRYDEALRRVETWADGARRDQCLALIYHGLGMLEKSDEYLNKLKAAVGATEPGLVVEVYGFRGDTETAFQWLQKSSTLCISRLIYVSPFLKSLRADARWAQVTARVDGRKTSGSPLDDAPITGAH